MVVPWSCRARASASVRGRGFTLIELVVALAVAGLLLAVVPLSLQRAHETAEYRATVRHMLAGLKSARHEAMRSGRVTAFAVDLEQRRFGVEDRLERGIADALEVSLVVAEQDIDARGSGRIRFYPDGSATGGSIDLLRPSGDGVRLRVDWLLGSISQYRLPLEAGR